MNLTKRILVGLMALLLLLSPVIALAQDEAELPEGWVEFISEDELVYVAHPEGYFAAVDPEAPGSLAVANSEDMLNRLLDEELSEEPAVAGDQAVLVTVFPAELMGILGMEVTEETTSAELLEGFMSLMAAEEEEPWELGEATSEEDEDGHDIAMQEVSIPGEEIEGYVVVTHEEGIVYFAVIGAYTGEFTEEWLETGLSILETVEVELTAEELMELFMGGAEAEATEEASE